MTQSNRSPHGGPRPQFGPWAPGIPDAERQARLRAMQALALVFARPHRKFREALVLAEHDPAALAVALDELERLPALNKRKILCGYADVVRAPR